MAKCLYTISNLLDHAPRYSAIKRYIGVLCLVFVFVVLFLTKCQLGVPDVIDLPAHLSSIGSQSQDSATAFNENTDIEQDESATNINSADNCNLDRKFMPNGSMPLILLLSFPGSGNTWVRYLIERASGIYSSSCYNDQGDGVGGEPAVFMRSNPCDRSTIVVKTHGGRVILSGNRLMIPKLGGETCQFDGAILLVRNPYGAILAEFNRQKGGKTGYANESDFTHGKWRYFANRLSEKWALSASRALTEISHRMIVYYEDLVRDTESEMRRLLAFLQVPYNEPTLKCLINNPSGNYKREHKEFFGNPYSESINRTVDKHIRNTRELLQRYHERPLPPYESTV